MSKPIDFMIWESSVFILSDKCLNKCLEFKNSFNLSNLIDLNEKEKINFLDYYKECVISCSNNFLISRDKTKEIIFKEIENVNNINNDTYKNFYK